MSPDGQLLAQSSVGIEPGALLRRCRRLDRLRQRSPVGEVLSDLFTAVDDRIREVASLVLREAAGAQLGVIGPPGGRELGERDHAYDIGIVSHVDVVAGIALGIVRLAGALRAVELPAHDGNVSRSLGSADERGHTVRQLLDCDAADPFVAGGTPRPAVSRASAQQSKDRHSDPKFHLAPRTPSPRSAPSSSRARRADGVGARHRLLQAANLQSLRRPTREAL
jgi:hypothetical protein